jgi:hypothetical protein
LAGAAHATGEKRIYEDALSVERSGFWDTKKLMAESKGEAGSRVRALDDVQVCSAQTCEPYSNDYLVRACLRIRDVGPAQDSRLGNDHCSGHVIPLVTRVN